MEYLGLPYDDDLFVWNDEEDSNEEYFRHVDQLYKKEQKNKKKEK